jgi:hypothetical protein
MWIPKSEAEIVNAVTSKSLQETVTFDAKKEIPSKNIETAKDVSAMANTAGGVLIYGIDEDENGFPTVLSPISLQGQSERIEAIIRTSIDEVPVFRISVIEAEAESSKGYLIVTVPPFERAPCMVIVKGERRFYGRGETGNYVLSQTEVARLYERRRIAETSILPILEENIQQSPITKHNGFAHLHVVIKPVLQDDNILDKALLPEQNHIQLLNTSVIKIIESDIFPKSYEPDFYVKKWFRRADGYLTKMYEPSAINDSEYTLYLEVNFDGSGSVFCSRAAETIKNPTGEVKWFLSDVVAGTTTKFLALFGEFYKRASYFGMVDIGVGLPGLENSIEYEIRNIMGKSYHYDKPNYLRTKRVSAMLLEESPEQVAADLVMPLINAVSQGRYNPFINKAVR